MKQKVSRDKNIYSMEEKLNINTQLIDWLHLPSNVVSGIVF